jgi:hypothetical protein
MNITKKITSIGVSLTTAIWLSGIIMLSPVAQAVTVAEIQAQINALLAQIQLLQTQLSAAQGTTSVSFTKDLTLGSKGTDVTALQNVLISANKGTAAAALAAVGATGYFGNLTKAALGEYQAAVGISPTAGYFGPKTRAYVASIGGVPITPITPITPIAPAGTLAAVLAIDSPSGSAISGAGQIDSLKFTLAAGSVATVTALKFTKIGVVSDNSINNLYLADETGVIIAQFSSLNKGIATFDGLSIAIGAGSSKTLTLRTDLSGATAGNTLAWKLDSVTAGDATVSGLPVAGNTLTVTTVSNPVIASATFTFNTVGSSVDAGTSGVLVASITANVGNSAVDLKNMKFTVVGSASASHLVNLQLKVNGAQVGSTLASVSSNGTAVFDLSSAASRLNTGNTTIELYADIIGSPYRKAQFTILRPYDIHVVDTQYNVGISPTVTTTNATEISINQGQITVQLASNTPIGNIPNGASNITLAKFAVYAAGESVKIKYINATITRAGGDGWDTLANATEDIQNIKLIDDAGGQVGSTISTIAGVSASGDCTLTATVATCRFGSSSSNINYTVPANTTRTLSLVVDILTTNDSTSLTGGLPGNQTGNLEGQISFQSATSGSAAGSTLTVVTTPLTVAVNPAFAAPTYAAGNNGVKIASFVVSASSAEGAQFSSLTFDKDIGTDTLDIQNVKVMVGTTQFGSPRPTVADGGLTMAFSGTTAATVSAGGSITIDIYADILSSSSQATHGTVIDFTGWSAMGTTSRSSITFPGAVTGQNVVVSSGPTITLAQGSATAAAQQLVMGSNNNSLFSVRINNDNVEDVKITDITFTDTIGAAATVASFINMTLVDGSNTYGPKTLAHISGDATSTVTFSFGTSPIIVAKNSPKTIVLRGDVASYASGGATSNSTHTFGIAATTDVTALGASNSSVSKSGTPSGKTQTVVITKLSLASVGVTGDQPYSSNHDIATIKWTASAGGQVTVNTVTIKFLGSAVTGSSAFSVKLMDGGSVWGSSASNVTCDASGTNTCSVIFSPVAVVDLSDTKDVKLRIDSASLANVANTKEGVSVSINAATDVLWSDGSTVNLPLESAVVPFTIVNVTYQD